ncbi:MAG: biotin/lipoyl-binding protein [Propionibacteriaceae bacterium]|jgi:biotin carboxyl carrier protein|nr:biotin/lipoyl-binding protein [Propionibacteriaceae bacterium]
MRHYNLSVNGQAYSLDVADTGPNSYQVTLADGTALDVVLSDSGEVTAGPAAAVTPAAPSAPAAVAPAAAQPYTAPMPGLVLSIAVQPGDTVTAGQTLLVLEAMKMKNELKASRAGTVATVHIRQGDNVKTGDPLIHF